MKKMIYWIGIVIVLAVGALLAMKQVLPICNTATFLMGLLFVWIGLMALLKVNNFWTREDSRLVEVLSSVIFLCFGGAYVVLSFFEAANQGLSVLVVSIPFIIAMTVTVAWSKWKNV